MRIKSITLKNGYKRFKDLTISLGDTPPKIVALVGPNGSGKSSVFDGMLYLQSKYGHIGSSTMNDPKYHSMEADPNFDSKWQKTASIEFDAGPFEQIIESKRTTGHEKTIFSFRSPYRYSSQLNVATLSRVQDIRANNIGAGSTAHIDEKVSDNYQRLYSLIDRKYKEPGSKMNYEQVKKEVLGDLNASLGKILEITIYDHGDILGGRGTLYFKKPGQEKEFDFNVLSSGEKEVVDILIDIYVRKESFKETVYIIDEPELHISTVIQRRLLNEIVKIVPDTSQIWISTHSIGFLNALKQDHNGNSAVILFPNNLSSEAAVLTPMINSRANWKMVFQTALEDLTGLLAPEIIIYCEGRKDPAADGCEQGLDAEIYNQIFEAEFSDVLFISSGGNTEPEKYSEIALKVLGKAFDDVSILLLKDKDIHSDKTPTTNRERTAWLVEAPDVRRMLERREIENYLYDLEILQKLKADIAVADYNRIVTDISDQNVKDMGVQIRTLCGKVQQPEDSFKRSLAKLITPDTKVYVALRLAIFNK